MGAARCSAQDVADAAKQERARKEAQQKKPKHIYTEEDLKRAKILSPEDRARVDAKKNEPAPATDEKSKDAVDAESLSPDAPLGDVARHLRRQKDSQELRRAQQFPLPLAEAPVLASPKPLLRSLRPPVSFANPIPPPFVKSVPPRFSPFQPPVKRSPFSRPNIFMAAPPRVLSSRPAPPSLAAPRPAAPIAPTKPSTRIASVQPPATRIAPTTSANLSVVVVKPGDSLWKLAEQNLGQGLRWHDLLEVNPNIRNANHIRAGAKILLPSAASSARTATTMTVQKGDSLSKIARAQFGHASSWSCIAQRNPSITDANLIFPGQRLILPATCKP
jgi:nucleoid-associated protein YgaU